MVYQTGGHDKPCASAPPPLRVYRLSFVLIACPVTTGDAIDLQKMEQYGNLPSQVTFCIYCFISGISGKFAETIRPRIDMLQLEAAL